MRNICDKPLPALLLIYRLHTLELDCKHHCLCDNYVLLRLLYFLKLLSSHTFFTCRENDVAAIDVNMGCPKDYSVKVSIQLNNKVHSEYCLGKRKRKKLKHFRPSLFYHVVYLLL